MKIFLIFVLGLSLVGCATFKEEYKKETEKQQAKTAEKNKAPEIQDVFIVNSSFDKVWKALVETLAEKSYPIKAIEKESGILTTDIMIFQDIPFRFEADKEIKRISERPSVFMAVWDTVKYSLNIFVSEIDKNTIKLKIGLSIEAHNNINGWHKCQSRGVIEKEIYDSTISKIK